MNSLFFPLATGRHASSIMSAEVAIQKFSFPFSCAVRLSQQDEVTQTGCVRVKARELHDLQENPVLSKPNSGPVIVAPVHKKQQERPAAAPGGDVAAAHFLVCTKASQSALLSGRSGFQKLTVENEDQRPAAKRQLSCESAAKTISVVKKSAVRKEAEEQRHLKPKTHLGQKAAPLVAATGRRRRRKDLFINSEVFHRVDAHVIRAGAEVRTLQHNIHLMFTAYCQSFIFTQTGTNSCFASNYCYSQFSLSPHLRLRCKKTLKKRAR